MRRETIVTVTHADARNDAFCGRDVSSRPRSSGTSGSTFTSYLSVVSIDVAFGFYVKPPHWIVSPPSSPPSAMPADRPLLTFRYRICQAAMRRVADIRSSAAANVSVHC
jgi:hypothetical protein